MNKVDINIKELAHQTIDSSLNQSYLRLDISGESVNSSFINSLRRTLLLYIPTYAFCKDSIDITENTSVMNNDYMRCRLEQFTYPLLKNNVVILDDKFWKNVSYKNSNKRERHPNDSNNIEYVISVTNNRKETLSVTTNDITVYDNGTKVDNNFSKEYPMLIIQLKEGQSFKCRAKCVLGIGKLNDIWAGASNVFFEELVESKYKFTVESQGQMSEYELLKKSCMILSNKIEKIKANLIEKYNNMDLSDKNEITLEIDGEDIMIGNLLNETLQVNNNIVFSGISKPHSFTTKVLIKVVSHKKNPLPHVFESIDYIIDCYKIFDSKITSIGKKYINFDY